MPINHSDVNFVLWLVRNHYRNGLKSENKLYDPAINEKHQRRNNNALLAHPLIFQGRRDRVAREPGREKVLIGQDLMDENVTYGNCTEMSYVVLFVCQQHLKGKCHSAWFARINTPGDHGFVLISEDGSLPKTNHVEGLATCGHGFWIIDCWLNVACEARDYPAMARAKLVTWSSQNKRILIGMGITEQRVKPDGNAYGTPFFRTGRLEFVYPVYLTGE
jgi:hypothetical protein